MNDVKARLVELKQRFTVLLLLSFSLCVWNTSALAQGIPVKVGGYEFPPFVEVRGDKYSGISIDIMNLLNTVQSKFVFEFVPTSPSRRYSAFDKNQLDLIMFEDVNWGWKDKPVTSSEVILTGGEVFITSSDGDKTQTYFDTLAGKSIGAMLGYHYGFAEFNSDPVVLREKYNAELNTAFQGNVYKVARDRVDVGIVTSSYLKKLIKEDPQLSNLLLVSEKYDQVYNHTMLLRDGMQLTVSELNTMIQSIQASGELNKIWEKYGLSAS